MRIFDKDGDIPIAAGSPSDSASVVSNSIIEGINRSRTTSPATASTASVHTPSDPPFGYLPNPTQPLFNFTSSQSAPNLHQTSPAPQAAMSQSSPHQLPPQPYLDTSPKSSIDASIPNFNYPPTTQFTPLPTTFAEMPHWSPSFSMPLQEPYSMPPMSQALASPVYNETYAASQGYPMTDYLYPQWSQHQPRSMGLNQEQQMELMQTFEANETGKIEAMIQQSNQLFRPHISTY